MSEVTKDDEPLSVRLKPLRAALDGLAFAAYEAGANGETMLGDCSEVAEWIEAAMSRAAEAVAAERERYARIVESYQVPVGNSPAGDRAAESRCAERPIEVVMTPETVERTPIKRLAKAVMNAPHQYPRSVRIHAQNFLASARNREQATHTILRHREVARTMKRAARLNRATKNPKRMVQTARLTVASNHPELKLTSQELVQISNAVFGFQRRRQQSRADEFYLRNALRLLVVEDMEAVHWYMDRVISQTPVQPEDQLEGVAFIRSMNPTHVAEILGWRLMKAFRSLASVGLPVSLPEPDLLVDCAQGFVEGWTASKVRAYAAACVAAERERFVRIVESYRVPVGNSAAGELAAQWTMDALREIRDQI
jgi:hypothetical protein